MRPKMLNKEKIKQTRRSFVMVMLGLRPVLVNAELVNHM